MIAGLFLGAPSAARAQSGIVGIVKDATGAVLPGVTVEASSPALIEKVRAVVTDEQGLYRIVELRPGQYSVTATLPGFATVRQDGLELPAGFTATVNIELKVSQLAELVTVVAHSSAVDVQNVTQSTTFSQNLILSLPSASRTPQSFAGFIPGVVGELNTYLLQQKTASIHDNRGAEADTRISGFSDTSPITPGGGGSFFYVNPLISQETSVITGAHPAEYSNAGIVNLIVPKQGGNSFAGTAYATYNGDELAWSNLSNRLRANGVTAVSTTTRYVEAAADVGGPVLRDRLWFYAAYRNLNIYRALANLYEPLDPLAWVYVPNLSKPAIVRTRVPNFDGRLTWALNEKNKFDVGFDSASHTNYQNGTAAANPGATTSIEAANLTETAPNYMTQVNWTAPVSSRFLLEGGINYKAQHSNAQLERQPVAVAPDTIAAIDQGGLIPGLSFRAATGGYGYSPSTAYSYRASASYTTGRTSAKLGMTLKRGTAYAEKRYNQDVVYTLNNGVTRSLTQYAAPILSGNRLNADLAIYAQDQLRFGRMTANLGVRFEYLNATALAVTEPANRWVGPRSYGQLDNVPNWKEISPRLGLVYDLFGDGKTALKASVNRYVEGAGTNIAAANNPATTAVTSATRTWNDANRNYVPECDFTSTAASGECGALSNVNFGSANPNATVTDPDVLHGWSKRPYNWEMELGVQRDLFDRIVLNAGYYRRIYGNFQATQNRATSPSGYSPYCITAPVDARLPAEVTGRDICGLYDIDPAQFGKVQNFVTFASKFGRQFEHFNGIDVNGTARLPRGAQLSGGVSYGRTETSACFIVNSPGDLRFCDNKTPFLPNIKAIGVVPLPWWDIQTSLALQSVPGPQQNAAYTAVNAQIAPSLGRNLAAGANGTAAIQLIQPGTFYGPQVSQLDLMVTKGVHFADTRSVKLSASVYNLLNSSAVQSVNQAYAPTAAWPQPTTTLDGRFFQFNVQVSF